jgi:hypothetical protein
VGDTQRINAASATAQNNTLCQAVQPFYWEIGDKTQVRGSGSVGTSAPTATTAMQIASASKLPFAAYVVQKYDTAGNSATFNTYVPYLNFTSGFSNFDNTLCQATDTIATCNNGGVNATEQANHTFHYEGGHMQQLAQVPLGLANDHATDLAAEVNGVLGTDFTYVVPQPAGGIMTTASSYGAFLRKLLDGTLSLGSKLGDDPVCTHAGNGCNAAVDSSVNALPDNFHYGLGHWIEDDPSAAPSSNFAYSSAGAHGFYPWVSFDLQWYGILARQSGSGETNGTGEGYDSLKCGRLIRQAWITGSEQKGTSPQ